MHKQSKRKAYFFGLYAEILAAIYLIFSGYKILKWRYKTSFGEIDLIAQRKDIIAIVEVKARSTIYDASHALTAHSQNRICKSAAAFLSSHPCYTNMTIRFDLIAIGGIGELRHLDNAWEYRA